MRWLSGFGATGAGGGAVATGRGDGRANCVTSLTSDINADGFRSRFGPASRGAASGANAAFFAGCCPSTPSPPPPMPALLAGRFFGDCRSGLASYSR